MTDVALNLVVICSADIERAKAFCSAIGLEFTTEQHGSGPKHYACEVGTTVFEIYPLKDAAPPGPCARLGFRVPTVDVALAVLIHLGAQIISPAKDSPWGRHAVVRDPDGHSVELTEGAGRMSG